MDPVRAQLAHNLRSRREEAGLSQERLADLCGLDRTEISLLERGERSPRVDTLVQLARGLQLKPGQLLDGVE